MHIPDYAVILAGGKGERFWPFSTSRKPKQFLTLLGDRSLLAQAVDRLSGLIPPERVLVITNAELRDAAIEAAPDLPADNIIGEPIGRDTAAAVALGLSLVRARDPNAAFCVLTADHMIGQTDLFRSTLGECLALAHAEEVLITIGMPPSEPSTSFGYIEIGAPMDKRNDIAFYRAKRFVEKPDHATAEQYVAGGRHFWNAGMFIWSCEALDRALAAHCPELHAMARALGPHVGKPTFDEALGEAYASREKISVDYAIMEKATNIVMARGEFPWDDVGSWPALARHVEADTSGNTILGDVLAHEASGNIVVSPDRLTAVMGVEDLVIVQAEGVTLVCPKNRAPDIKALLRRLRETGKHLELL